MKGNKFNQIFPTVLAALLFLLFHNHASSVEITVNSEDISCQTATCPVSVCTMCSAINFANNTPAPVRILFDTSHTIEFATGLPTLTSSDVSIEGGSHSIEFKCNGGGCNTITGLVMGGPGGASQTLKALTFTGFATAVQVISTGTVDINIKNCSFRQNTGTGMSVEASGVAIGNNINTDANIFASNSIGIVLSGTAAIGTFIYGNYFGVDSLNNEHPNDVGIYIQAGASSNYIGSTTANTGNIISSNNTAGIVIDGTGSDSNTVYGNYIGINSAGDPLPNDVGIYIQNGASANVIGSDSAPNTISDNDTAGIIIDNSSANEVYGNFIGVSSAGDPLPNDVGIYIQNGASANVIGSDSAPNTISKNNTAGIIIDNSSTNEVYGNFIGINDSGTSLPNDVGIYIQNGASANVIGSDSAPNTISYNDTAGIIIDSSSTNEVYGNYIGINDAGTPLPNDIGIYIRNAASNNIIGSTTAGNVVSANTSAGILIDNSATNTIQGNWIGSDNNGDDPGGSGQGFGVKLTGTSSGNIIGADSASPLAAEGNIIAWNSGAGIEAESTTEQNRFSYNLIYENGALGIDLAPSGVSPSTSIANNGIAAPTFVSFLQTDTDEFKVTLSAPGAARIEVFHAKTNDIDADGTGYGEAPEYIGSISGTSGSIDSITSSISPPYFTAIAIAANGDTSEFSANYTDTEAPDFNGLQKIKGCGTGCLRLSWDPASDPQDSTPITYNIYQDDGSPVSTAISIDSVSDRNFCKISVDVDDDTPTFFIVEAQDRYGNETSIRKESYGISAATKSFAPDPNNPTLSGTNTTFAGGVISAPSVFYATDDSVFVMFFTETAPSSQASVISRAVSLDGANWTMTPAGDSSIPVFSTDAIDTKYVSAPFVLPTGGGYRMWYTGGNGTTEFIRTAESTDGFDWNNRSSLTWIHSQDFESQRRSDPTVYKTSGGLFYMWYTGTDNSNVKRIGFATSSNGTNWITATGTWSGGSALDFGDTDDFDESGASEPSVYYDGSLYHMLYTGTGSDGIRRIGYAVSDDGQNWTKGGGEGYGRSVIEPQSGTGQEFDDNGIFSPHWIVRDGVLWVWYTGINGSDTKIGLGVTDSDASVLPPALESITITPTDPNADAPHTYPSANISFKAECTFSDSPHCTSPSGNTCSCEKTVEWRDTGPDNFDIPGFAVGGSGTMTFPARKGYSSVYARTADVVSNLVTVTASAPVFISSATRTAPVPTAAVAADFTGSSLPDFVTAGDELILWTNAGDGTFSQGTLSTDDKYAVIAADIDADNDIDVISAGPGGIFVHYNESGVFSTSDKISSNPGDTLAICDSDNSGTLDIAAGTSLGLEIFTTVIDANQDAIFTGTTALSGIAITSLNCGDIDSDGIAEIIAGTGSGIQIIERNGTTYTTSSTLSSAGSVSALVLLNQNNDSAPDIITVGDGYFRYYVNTSGIGDIVTQSIDLGGVVASTLITGDLDNDGYSDAIVGTTGGTPDKVLLFDSSTADGSFFVDSQIFRESDDTTLTFFDAENDSDLDALTSTGSDGFILRYSNMADGQRGNTSNSDPGPSASDPGVQFATITHLQDISFSWIQHSDTETPGDLITYSPQIDWENTSGENITLRSGAVPISRAYNSNNLLLELGDELGDGTYTVRIGAVDSGMRQGADSTVAKFTRDTTPPSTPLDVTITPVAPYMQNQQTDYINSKNTLSLSWSPSTDSQTNIAKYEYIVYTSIDDSTSSGRDWTNTGVVTATTVVQLSLTENATYQVEIKAWNYANLSRTSSPSNEVVVDTEKPVIGLSVGPTDTITGIHHDEIDIDISLQDAHPIFWALEYQPVGYSDAGWKQLASGTGNFSTTTVTWDTMQTSTSSTGYDNYILSGDYNLRIRASDAALWTNLLATGPSISNLDTINYQDNLGGDDLLVSDKFAFISLPMDLIKGNIWYDLGIYASNTEILRWDETLSSCDEDTYFYRYKRSATDSTELKDIGPGYGLALRYHGDDVLKQVEMNSTDTSEPYELSLACYESASGRRPCAATDTVPAGWNMIGTPFPWNYKWQNILVKYSDTEDPIPITDSAAQTYIDTIAIRYDEDNDTDGAFVSTSVDITSDTDGMQPWRGYYLRCKANENDDISLLFPPVKNDGSLPKIVRPTVPLEFKLTAKESIPGAIGTEITGGFIPGAEAGTDPYDGSEAPGILPYIGARFTDNAEGRLLARDIRNAEETASWQIEVYADWSDEDDYQSPRTAYVEWNTTAGSDRYDITITDSLTGEILKAGLPSSVTLDRRAAHRFKVTAKLKQDADITLEREFPSGWNLVSIPLDFDDPAARSVFREYSTTAFQHYLDKYLLPAETDIQPGVAYWIYSQGENLSFTGNSTSGSGQMSLPLNLGWNAIGSPFTEELSSELLLISDGITTMPLKDAPAAGWVSPWLYYFNGYVYEKAAISSDLAPWKGYFMNVHVDGLTLTFMEP